MDLMRVEYFIDANLASEEPNLVHFRSEASSDAAAGGFRRADTHRRSSAPGLQSSKSVGSLRRAFAVTAALATTPAFAGAPQAVVLDVQNMTCALCPITVKKSLQQVPGVAGATIDLDKKTA